MLAPPLCGINNNSFLPIGVSSVNKIGFVVIILNCLNHPSPLDSSCFAHTQMLTASENPKLLAKFVNYTP